MRQAEASYGQHRRARLIQACRSDWAQSRLLSKGGNATLQLVTFARFYISVITAIHSAARANKLGHLESKL